MPLSIVVLFAVIAGIMLLVSQRLGELFCVSIRDGKLLVIRGKIPQRLLLEFDSIAKDTPALQNATLIARREESRARLIVRGDVSEGRQQQMRNVFCLYALSRLTKAPVATERNLGQLLGVAWLAWWMRRRP